MNEKSTKMSPVAINTTELSSKSGAAPAIVTETMETSSASIVVGTEMAGTGKKVPTINVFEWTKEQVIEWAQSEKFSKSVIECIRLEDIDGRALLTLSENDIRDLREKINSVYVKMNRNSSEQVSHNGNNSNNNSLHNMHHHHHHHHRNSNGYNNSSGSANENNNSELRKMKIGEMKKLWISIRTLQKENASALINLGLADQLLQSAVAMKNSLDPGALPIANSSCGCLTMGSMGSACPSIQQQPQQHYLSNHHHHHHHHHINGSDSFHHHHFNDLERISPPLSVDGRATSVPPEVFKTVISLGYSFLVTWITAFVMVVVHERVPDMKRYPPLPDIFLDNVPHIPWAFHMCEITGTLLFAIWLTVCIFHKYRLVLLRRFFALAGTVFLLRCVTMLITSLSVPGTHLQCNPNDYKVDDTNLTLGEALELRISRAYTIWSGLGMSIQGVRTCGDYMFSGHTVALTLLNFFITEYTPRHLYFLHTMTWLLNMFGIFFILAAHEHYSIDVFVAFYITSRLFLYYHTLANNQALMSHDSTRTRIWFPMFSYFESSVDGIIPNEYDSGATLLSNIFSCIVCVKDSFMLTARRFWISPGYLPPISKAILRPISPKKLISATSKIINGANSSPKKNNSTMDENESNNQKQQEKDISSEQNNSTTNRISNPAETKIEEMNSILLENDNIIVETLDLNAKKDN